ncbi:hypothetical protein D1BOALGB6SA_3428 [Olavius sp. associated proteobacterium Delta 1]|nr:hypothetical protein D1BOALGB6SA_3428 [Olavius sp. associated proteobacterium Delta 1]
MAEKSFQSKIVNYVLRKRPLIPCSRRLMQTGGFFKPSSGRYAGAIFPMILIILITAGCAQFQHKMPEALPFMDRSQTKTEDGVRVTVAVPSAEESEQIFGFPLAGKNIQPVWLEIENNRDNEIAWFFKPGTTNAGFVYTNLKMGTKAVLVKLFAEKWIEELPFFVEVPGLKADHHQLNPHTLYSEKDLIDLDDDGLRQALEKLPCCMTNKDGTGKSDPLNIVVIGPDEEIWPAFITRNWDESEIIYRASLAKTIASSLFGRRYRYSPMSPLYFYGRPQDVGL